MCVINNGFVRLCNMKSVKYLFVSAAPFNSKLIQCANSPHDQFIQRIRFACFDTLTPSRLAGELL